MSRYKDYSERRGKRHGNDDGGFSDEVSEPSYFQALPPEAVDAEVLWFNTDKGFGFIRLSDGTEAYLHIRGLEAARGGNVSEGTRLKVTVEEGPRGRQVVKVLEIGDRIPKASPGERQAEDFATESEGMVKWYNPEKGFGFIAPENGENDVFVHATALGRSGLSVLSEGQKVIFQSGQGKKGREVRAIRLA